MKGKKMVYSSGSTSSTGSIESLELSFIKDELVGKSHNERCNILSDYEEHGILNWEIGDYYYDQKIGDNIFYCLSWIHRSGTNGYFIG
jgi:hypothetical protein